VPVFDFSLSWRRCMVVATAMILSGAWVSPLAAQGVYASGSSPPDSIHLVRGSGSD
jgi:hypothetical protein